MSINDDYNYDEDFDETTVKKDEEEEKQIEKELESEANDLDVDGFSEMYRVLRTATSINLQRLCKQRLHQRIVESDNM